MRETPELGKKSMESARMRQNNNNVRARRQNSPIYGRFEEVCDCFDENVCYDLMSSCRAARMFVMSNGFLFCCDGIIEKFTA